MERPIGIKIRIVGMLDITCVRIDAAIKITVLIINGLGLSPRMLMMMFATASPAPQFFTPAEIALSAPTRIRQFQSIALIASLTVMQPLPTMIRAPTTAAMCIGKVLDPDAITTRTAIIVITQIAAFFLLNSFFSACANSGTYPVSGIIFIPINV